MTTTARDAEVQSADLRLPAKLAAHPSVRAVSAGDVASPPAVIDAAWLRELCLAAGADDAAAVSLDHPDLDGEREHALAALPGTRTLIAMAVRMNRDRKSPAAGSPRRNAPHPPDPALRPLALCRGCRRRRRTLESARTTGGVLRRTTLRPDRGEHRHQPERAGRPAEETRRVRHPVRVALRDPPAPL